MSIVHIHSIAPSGGHLFFAAWRRRGRPNRGSAINSLNFQQIAQWCIDNYLLILGFLGQGFFSGRFLAQWIASEKQGKSVVPLSFWYLSVGGGGLLLIYAILRKDPVFILGQGGGLVIYARNLYLIHKERGRKKVSG